MTDDPQELARLLPDPARHELGEHRQRSLREHLMKQIDEDRTAADRPVWRRHAFGLATGVAAAVALVAATSAVVLSVGGFWASPTPNGAGQPVDPVGVPTGVPANPTVTITHGVRHSGDIEQPPPFRVRFGGTELHLNPHTYCYGNGCVDGFDNDPPSVGSPDELFVFVPVPAFDQLTVQQLAGGGPCGRAVDAEVTPLGGHWWRVRPRGPAAEYQVSLFASGRGDMIASLRWTTPSDQSLPDPSARLALIADHDGVPDSYGLELQVVNLATSPTEYSATITVTAGNGRSLTFDAIPSATRCTGAGELNFDGPDSEAARAAGLGDFPFTIRVELVLDGVRHVATATYPDDEIEGNEPWVVLRFTPPLAGGA
jgi:hypothetical protein